MLNAKPQSVESSTVVAPLSVTAPVPEVNVLLLDTWASAYNTYLRLAG